MGQEFIVKILAVDTSTLTGSVALLFEEEKQLKTIGEITLSVSVVHSERLLPAIQRLLEEAGASLAEIDLFGVAHGPGSFTGLRIGMATVQGLSLSTGKPAVGVSSLETLAMNAVLHDGLVVPMFDARRGEVYSAVYKANGARPRGLESVEPEVAVSPEKFLELLSLRDEPTFLMIGRGAEVYRTVILERLGSRALFAPALLNIPRASHVGLLAWEGASENRPARENPLSPRYLRSAEVTFPKPTKILSNHFG
ncbi:MAG: tRNA (adenosine(37)-N6)-threonylcarbamoyltransferase complex dimerization subunit type 1 TsaB [Deltaproteobacteria bacterium]|nr:tRNA (adenosine(37)-N6)-threonylcarbamoyltransferase complex dimerization subunit type 1 TsaB [Deltaproteobacteria bacterium]